MNEVSRLIQARLAAADQSREYRALVGHCALVARDDRAAVSVEGPRAAEMLDGLVSNRVTGLVEEGRQALLLTSKGHALAVLTLFPWPGGVLVVVPRAALTNLLTVLGKYLPPRLAVFADRSAELEQLGLYGPRAAEAARAALGVDLPDAALGVREVEVGAGRVLLVRDRRLAGDGVEVIAPGALAPGVAVALLDAAEARGGGVAGAGALEVVRVESGVPLYGVDVSEDNLAQETGLEGEAIAYDKGCYMGQEVVARIHFQGHVNRRLVGLGFEGQVAAPPRAILRVGPRAVGAVTSSVVSPDLGPIGLGYVRREVELGATVGWENGGSAGRATVVRPPFRSWAV
jgi:folate-binding protein YgfZ